MCSKMDGSAAPGFVIGFRVFGSVWALPKRHFTPEGQLWISPRTRKTIERIFDEFNHQEGGREGGGREGNFLLHLGMSSGSCTETNLIKMGTLGS